MKLGDHAKVMADLQDEIAVLTQRIEEALAALCAWHRPLESLRAMLVPDTAHIQSLIDRHREDAAEEKTYRDTLDAKAKEVCRLLRLGIGPRNVPILRKGR